MGYSKLRMVWIDMKRRCDNPNRIAYKDYGGRGIKVCEEWDNDYMLFKEWALNNGYSEKLLLDRINNDGNYEPSNCKFVNRFESELNKRKNGLNNIRFYRNKHEVSMRRYGVYFYVGIYNNIYDAITARNEFINKIDTLKLNILKGHEP
jgi:hypothetical protein